MIDIDLAKLKSLAAEPGDIGRNNLAFWMADHAQDIISTIERLQHELGETKKALAYAINEADGWHDECHGGRIETPEMDAARMLAAGQPQD